MYCKFCGTETGADREICDECLKSQGQSEKVPKKDLGIRIAVAVLAAMILVCGITAALLLKNKFSSENAEAHLTSTSESMTSAQTEPGTTKDGETVVIFGENVTRGSETQFTTNEAVINANEGSSEPQTVVSTPNHTAQTATSPATNALQPSEKTYDVPIQPGKITLSESLQYDLNIFLSNFSESNVGSFSSQPSNEELADFALTYNFINRQNLFESGEYSIGEDTAYNYRLDEKYAIETIKKYFDISVKPGFADGYRFYHDGYFYLEFTGAALSEGFSVVSSVEDVGGNLYKVNFAIYMSDGNDQPYYGYTTQRIQSESASNEYLRYVCDGTAYIRATNIYDRSTYILDSYHVSR